MSTRPKRLLLNLAGGAAAAALVAASGDEAGPASSFRPPRRRESDVVDGDVGRQNNNYHRRRRKLARLPPRRTGGGGEEEDEDEDDPLDLARALRGESPATMTMPLPLELMPRLPDRDDVDDDDDDDDNGGGSDSYAGGDVTPFAARIIGGAPTPEFRYPYVASLLDMSSGSHVCGGTLIAPDVVLTAGHCSGFFDSIKVGIYDLSDREFDTFDHLIVEEHRAHPLFGNVIMNDFGLAKLYGTSRNASPVRINNRRNVPEADDILTVLGWGVTQVTSTGIALDGTSPDVLHHINVTYVTNEACDDSTGLWKGDTVSYSGHIKDNMMCAKRSHQDACKGDSGGPMIAAGDSEAEDVQLGIISWGLGCATDSFPGVYSRISWEYDWIAMSVCEMSSYPPSYFGCPTAEGVSNSDVDPTTDDSASARDVEMVDVTVAIELDAFPEETSYVLEVDPASAASGGGWTTDKPMIDGESQVPLKTFTFGLEAVTRTVKVAQNQVYRLTLLDSGKDGLLSRSGGDGDLPSRFRMCYGVVGGDECLNASLESDLVICHGTGDFYLARSISCPVNVQQPFEIPLDLIMDDDRLRPSTTTPSFSPTKAPSSNSTFIDGSTFVGSTFVTKPTPATTATPGDGESNNATVDKPAKTDGAVSSSSLRVTSIAALAISTFYFAV